MTDRRSPVGPGTAPEAEVLSWVHAPWRHKPLLQFLALWLIASPLGGLVLFGLLFPGQHRLELLDRRGVHRPGHRRGSGAGWCDHGPVPGQG
jgi:hypothetical protein